MICAISYPINNFRKELILTWRAVEILTKAFGKRIKHEQQTSNTYLNGCKNHFLTFFLIFVANIFPFPEALKYKKSVLECDCLQNSPSLVNSINITHWKILWYFRVFIINFLVVIKKIIILFGKETFLVETNVTNQLHLWGQGECVLLQIF